MANYLLTLREDAALAPFNLGKPYLPSKIFFVDLHRRLHQIARNSDPVVQKQLATVLDRTDAENWSQLAHRHLRLLRKRARAS